MPTRSSFLLGYFSLAVAPLIGLCRLKLGDTHRLGHVWQPIRDTMLPYRDRPARPSEGLVGLTDDGTIAAWDAAAERISGLKAREVIGRPLSMLATPFTHAEQTAWLTRACRGEAVGAYEIPRPAKDGCKLELSPCSGPLPAA